MHILCVQFDADSEKSDWFDWDLSAFIVGFGLEAIHGFRSVVRTWTEASRLHLGRTTCTRSPFRSSTPTASGVMSSIVFTSHQSVLFGFNMTWKKLTEATHSGICQLQASCMTLWRKLCWKGLHCSFLEDHYCFDDIR